MIQQRWNLKGELKNMECFDCKIGLDNYYYEIDGVKPLCWMCAEKRDEENRADMKRRFYAMERGL